MILKIIQKKKKIILKPIHSPLCLEANNTDP